jgi:hypothetical protein
MSLRPRNKVISLVQVVLLATLPILSLPVDEVGQTPPGFIGAAQATQPPKGTFRLILNGFKVNHESDDDIFEGDGRGDEIFITSSAWVVHNDGSYERTPKVQTKVMGDPNNHPERIPAGSAHPGPTSLNVMIGGLHTGDSFPANQPWRRTLEPLADRPPIVLWQGELTADKDISMIVPVIWEWDSSDYSASQRSVDRELPGWFQKTKANLISLIPATRWLNPVEHSVIAVDFYHHTVYEIQPINSLTNRADGLDLRLDAKSGTRPIGYEENVAHFTNSSSVPMYDALNPREIVLNYYNAIAASSGAGMRLEINYTDAHDHGDYTLYLQVEQVTSLRQTVPLRPVRP